MKKTKFEDPAMKPPKAMMQLVDSFTDSFRCTLCEEDAEEVFNVARLREYFNAWPVPKMPDPLPPYLNELERRGFAMQTGYDGQPALFCIRNRARVGEYASATDEGKSPRYGLETLGAMLERRMCARVETDDEDEEDTEEDETGE